MATKGKSLNDSLEQAKKQIQLLQLQLNSVLSENDQLRTALNPLSERGKKALSIIKGRDNVRPLKLGNTDVGLVLKLDGLRTPVGHPGPHFGLASYRMMSHYSFLQKEMDAAPKLASLQNPLKQDNPSNQQLEKLT